MIWSGNFREGLAREIRENKTLAKITAYTVYIIETIIYPGMANMRLNYFNNYMFSNREFVTTEHVCLLHIAY